MALYNSFYGGKRGAPFIITKSYKSVAAMIEDFKLGPGFGEVEYDEYVMIDTEDLNNWENGDIYRRGYNYENDMGGAEYIGKIQGPVGYSPLLAMDSYEKVAKLIEDNKNLPDVVLHGTITAHQNDRWSYGSYGDENSVTYTPYNESEETTESSDEYEHHLYPDLVPGKYYENANDTEGKFNDNIDWVLCSMQDEHSHQTTAWVGFKIPYLVIEQDAESVSPYYHRSDISEGNWNNADNLYKEKNRAFVNQKLIVRDDGRWQDSKTADHPFYEHFQISIPKGIKGDALRNFRIVEVQNNDNIMVDSTKFDDGFNGNPDYHYSTSEHNNDKNRKLLDEFNQTRAGAVGGGRQVLVFDYVNYDRIAEGEKQSLYLGDFNMINNIELTEHGSVIIDYTHDDSSVWSQIFRWIKNIELNPDTGLFTVTYNNIDPVTKENIYYSVFLDWVKDISIANDGTVTFDYTHSPDKVMPKLIKWVDDVSLNGRTGEFTMSFNQGDVYNTTLRYLNGASITEDGTVTFSYTTGPDMVQSDKLKWVSEVVFDGGEKEGQGTQCIEVHFNNGSKEIISKPINYIMKTVIDKHHLLVLNSDPAKRQLAIDEGRSATYDGRSDWEDLGSVKEYSGILIGKNINPDEVSQVSTVAGTITYLNSTYPNGLTGDGLEGKVITVDSGDKKIFYAFDYDKKQWYRIGTIDVVTNNIVGRADDLTTLGKAEEMSIGGLWFVVTDSNE